MPKETRDPTLNTVSGITVCDLCLDGRGGICYSPGCLFYLSSTPDVKIRGAIVASGGNIVPLPAPREGV